jgi:predicted nucleotidyltransferase
MSAARLQELERPEVAAFCRRWKVRELAVFGSVLRGDSRPDSDIDLLVTFEADANWGLLEQAAMESELASLLGRKVDLISRRAIERSANWIRRQAILESAETVHVAR